MVALPSELVPLHIFEERYKTMIARCLEDGSEFGIVWLSDDGLRPVGCACEIAEVLERMPDGRLNLIARGTRAFRIEARQDELAYPAGTVEFLDDRPEDVDAEAAEAAHTAYAELVRQATDRPPQPDRLEGMSAYEMAATVEFGLDAKQGLPDLRSEAARRRLVPPRPPAPNQAPPRRGGGARPPAARHPAVPGRDQASGLRRARPGEGAPERQGD